MKSLKVGLVLEIAEVEEATIKEVIGLGGEVRKEVIQMMIIITVEAVQEANTIEVEGDALIIEENLINNLI